jgi:hypothetical protein
VRNHSEQKIFLNALGDDPSNLLFYLFEGIVLKEMLMLDGRLRELALEITDLKIILCLAEVEGVDADVKIFLF